MAIGDGQPYYIQSLMNGVSWTGMAGASASLTYAFNQTLLLNTVPMNAVQKAATLGALASWSNVANVGFAQTNAPADIAFRQGEMGPGIAGGTWSWSNASNLTRAEVVIDNDENSFSVGGYSYYAMVHEIGHALGLKHPGDYNAGGGGANPPFLPDAEDNRDFTVMAYDWGAYVNGMHIPTTPLLYDVAAIQYLYGANASFRSGATLYNVTGATNAWCLWDGGGNDTISAAGFTGNARLDLSEGKDEVNIVGDNMFWIAFGANIEHAKGGSGNDTISGNALANGLDGGGGSDTLTGGAGNDTLTGGAGNDDMQGGIGADVFVYKDFNLGHDVIHDFTPGVDKIDVSALHINFTTLTSNSHQSGSDLIGGSLTGAWSVTLEHVSGANIHASDFIF